MAKKVILIVLAVGLLGAIGYTIYQGVTAKPADKAPAANVPVKFNEAEARAIAEKSCIKGGEALGPGVYNPNSKTWWFDANLNATQPGCNPACMVSEQTKIAEINWRCTGLLPQQ